MDALLVVFSLLSAVCFALGLVLSRGGLRHMPPVQGAATSVPTTALLFLLASPVGLSGAGFDARGAAIFLLSGCLYPAAVTLLNFAATRRIGAEVTGALGNLTPLFAVLLAWALLGEAPSAGQVLALAVILAGMALLFGRPGRWKAGSAIAFALPLAGALVRGMVQPAVKLGLTEWPSPFAAALCAYIASASVLLTVSRLAPGRRDWPVPSPRGRLWFMAVGVANGLAVLFLYAALARGPVAVVAPLTACYPLLTPLLGRWLPGYVAPTRGMLAGILVTVAGVMLLLVS
jgi:drug/metabolite transporter (DMT)-like permease